MKCYFCHSYIEVKTSFKFSKNQKHLELYGELLNSEFNIEKICSDCELAHPLTRWTEVQFCDALNIEPVSVEGKIIFKQLNQKGCCG